MSFVCRFPFMQIRKVSHLDSFWNRGSRKLGNGLLLTTLFSFVFIIILCCCCFSLGFMAMYCLSYNFKKASGIGSKFNNLISTYPNRFVYFPIDSAMNRKNCCWKRNKEISLIKEAKWLNNSRKEIKSRTVSLWFFAAGYMVKVKIASSQRDHTVGCYPHWVSITWEGDLIRRVTPGTKLYTWVENVTGGGGAGEGALQKNTT